MTSTQTETSSFTQTEHLTEHLTDKVGTSAKPIESFKGVKVTDISHRNFKPFKGFQTSKPVSRTKPMELNAIQQSAVDTYLRAVVRTPEGRKQYEKNSEKHNIDSLCIHINELAIAVRDDVHDDVRANQAPGKNVAPIISGDPEVIELMDSFDPSSEFWVIMKFIDDDLHSKPKISLIKKIIELVDCHGKAKKFVDKLTERIQIMMNRFDVFGYESYKRSHAFMIVCKGEDRFKVMQEDEVFLDNLDEQFDDMNVYLRSFPDGL